MEKCQVLLDHFTHGMSYFALVTWMQNRTYLGKYNYSKNE